MTARARWVRPEFFKHERLATLSALHRLLFIALWQQADREGRLEDRPMRLKIECLPYDNCDVDAMIDDLEAHPDRLVVRYESEGRHFLAIPGFVRHQNIHPREPQSELPEIPAEYMHCSCMGHASGTQAGACLMHRCKSRRVEGNKSRRGKGEKSAHARELESPLFGAFYDAYPKKKNRREALAAWTKHVTSPELAATIMTALERHKADEPDWQREGGRYIPYPASWLNGQRWNDEVGPAVGSVNPMRAMALRALTKMEA